ncbi:hypothetical protein ACFU3E_09295 [Streptomyces sp. NPDC057424]|uniref:hypothetical protein n=1 Tax=Streptomyces sp. NPDC057424 TaxID=3346127 RepID=UPI0036A46E97
MPESDAGRHLQNQFEISARTSAGAPTPMPVFAVHTHESRDDDAVAGLVRLLYTGQEAHGTCCAVARDAYEGRTEVRPGRGWCGR